MRVAPGTMDQRTQNQNCDINQQQTGQDFIGVIPGLQECRDRGPRHSPQYTQNQHRRQHENILRFRKVNHQ